MNRLPKSLTRSLLAVLIATLVGVVWVGLGLAASNRTVTVKVGAGQGTVSGVAYGNHFRTKTAHGVHVVLPTGKEISLTETPAKNFNFLGWSGAPGCHTNKNCNFRATRNTTVVARFGPKTAAAVQQLLPQTITVTSPLPTEIYGQLTPWTITATGGGSNNPVVFSTDSTSGAGVCSVSSNVVTFFNVGACVIDANQAGTTRYAAAPTVRTPINVGFARTTTIVTLPIGTITTTQTFPISVTVTSLAATGQVTVFDGGSTVLGSCTLSSGVCQITAGPLSAGNHSITATYSGSADHNYAGSTSLPLTQAIALTPTATQVSSSANPSVLGSSVTFTATTTTNATGTVQLKAGTAAIGTPCTLTTVLGITSCSISVSSLPSGSSAITAVYPGDATYAASTSSAVTQNVVATGSTTTVVSSSPTSVYGTQVTFTATVPTNATGTVTINDGATPIGGCTVATVASVSSCHVSTSALAGGAHSITAVYSGDASYATSTSAVLTQTVTQAAGTTSVASSLNPSVYGGAVTLTATVPTGATGTVTFKDGASVIGSPCTLVTTTTTTCAITTSTLAGGARSITAVYSGDTNYAGATSSALVQTVNTAPTTTTVSSGTNPSVSGTNVIFTATVSTGATGTVTIKDGTTTLGSACTLSTTNGITSCTVTAALTNTPSASHSITAVYSGDTNYTTSTSAVLTQNVVATASSTTLVSSANPSTYGGAVTLTATVPTGATGTVSFKDGTSVIGTPCTIVGTTCAITTLALTGGAHSITAVYSGDANYASSTSAVLTQTVNKAASTTTLASTLNPSTYGAAVTLTATVPAGATGTVSFLDGAAALGTPCTIVGTTCAITTSALTGGAHSITAVYSGDTNYATSTSSVLAQTVNKAATTTGVVSSALSQAPGAAVTFTVTVTTNATGTVNVNDGATLVGSCTLATASSVTSCGVTTTTLAIGTHSITATYVGDTNYATSTSTPALSEQITSTNTPQTITVTAPPATVGYGGTFTASATASSTLSVSITASGTCTGSGTSPVVVTMAASGLGNCVVTYTQVGNATYAAAPTQTSSTQPVTIITPGGVPASSAPGTSFVATATTNTGLPVAISGSGACTGSGDDTGTTIYVNGNAGTCTVTYDATSDGVNYNAAPTVTTTTTVTSTTQSITVINPAPASAAFGTSFTVDASATSQLNVSIAGSGGCTGAGTNHVKLTMTSGTTACTVTYTQAGNAGYSAATPVSSQTSATIANQTITVTQNSPGAQNPPSNVLAGDTFDVAATASSGQTVAVTIDPASSAVCTIADNGDGTFTVTTIAAGTCSVDYNQAGLAGNLAAAPQIVESTTVS